MKDGTHWNTNDWNSTAFCVISTRSQTIRLTDEDDFTLLWNPGHAAKVKWVEWPHGTGNTNFPEGVVKSDDVCDFKVGRHMGENYRTIGGFHRK